MSSLLLLKSMLYSNAVQKNKKRKIKKVKKTPLIKNQPNKKLPISLCRICKVEKGEIPIFNNNMQPNIPQEIQNFSGITLQQTENLSKEMCKSCLDLLNGCILFRELCQKNNNMKIEISIKKETNIEDNYCEDKQIDDRDDHIVGDNKNHIFDNMPSPTYSDDNSELWTCAVCNKQFCNMSSYDIHTSKCRIEVDHKLPKEIDKKKYLCHICGKTAFSNAGLYLHIRIHKNVFPFKCDVCPYQGKTFDLLKIHKRSHLIDKPYKCTQCPKTTTTSSNLAKHMRHVHSTSRPHKVSKSHKCNFCDKAFSYQHDMKRHVKDIHLRQGTVECDICYKKFSTRKILQGHKWKIHKIKAIRQGRLPAYLQYQMDEQNENTNECDTNDRENNPTDTTFAFSK